MKMLPVTMLFACHCLRVVRTTFLPLEIYELRSGAAAAAAGTTMIDEASATAATASANNGFHYYQIQQQQTRVEEYKQESKYNNLEDATIVARQQQQKKYQLENKLKQFTSQATTTAQRSPLNSTIKSQNQLDRRRTRQILDEFRQKQRSFNHSTLQNYLHNSHNYLHHRQPQQHHNLSKDIRILYQTGNFEKDLPICAFNAVCSKIDLYETPWIERQCRCPSIPTQSTNLIIHHYNNNINNTKKNNDRNDKRNNDTHNHLTNKGFMETTTYSHIFKQNNNETPNKSCNGKKYQHQHHYSNNNDDNNKQIYYYEHENLRQRRQYILKSNNLTENSDHNQDHDDDNDDTNGKRYENVHLKNLMQKLGAVFEDNLDLVDTNVFLDSNEDDDYENDNYLDELNANIFINSHLQQQQTQSHHHRHKLASASEQIHGLYDRQQPLKHYKGTPYTSVHAHYPGAHHSGVPAKELDSIGGCPSGLSIEDGHTVVDKTRYYKLCNPVHKLPLCRHFRDYTWTLTVSADSNVTEHIVHCRCPRNSIVYLKKGEPTTDRSGRSTYSFVCSPFTRIRCQRKEPCKLFTVRKRQEFIDEVNITIVCQCPKGHHCPSHHTQSGVIPGGSYRHENIKTYSGYCMAND